MLDKTKHDMALVYQLVPEMAKMKRVDAYNSVYGEQFEVFVSSILCTSFGFALHNHIRSSVTVTEGL